MTLIKYVEYIELDCPDEELLRRYVEESKDNPHVVMILNKEVVFYRGKEYTEVIEG